MSLSCAPWLGQNFRGFFSFVKYFEIHRYIGLEWEEGEPYKCASVLVVGRTIKETLKASVNLEI